MADPILTAFLRKSHTAAMALAAASDRLVLIPEPGEIPQRYIAEFHCHSLVRLDSGEITVAEFFRIGIAFHDDYLKSRPNTMRLLTWLEPEAGIWHPNVAAPFVCPGDLRMGTDLVGILFQLYEILTYQKFATADCLNPVAAEFARANLSRFPIDPRPLRRRAVQIQQIEGATP
jgi:hypothetical protein